jgi:hypothetical protein
MSWLWWPKVRPGVKNHHPETTKGSFSRTVLFNERMQAEIAA